MKTKDYTIFATLSNDLEKIIQANFLDSDELAVVESVMVPLFDKHDKYMKFANSMTETELFDHEVKNENPKFCVPYPYFVLDNKKHKDLICYLKLAGIGIELDISEIPNVFDSDDSIVLIKE